MSSSSSSSDTTAATTTTTAHTAGTEADEAIIASLLGSPRDTTEQSHHQPHQTTAAESILAAADKPISITTNTDKSFYSGGLDDLQPQALSPIAGNSPRNDNSSNGTKPASFSFQQRQLH
jgi:hypothetical protein